MATVWRSPRKRFGVSPESASRVAGLFLVLGAHAAAFWALWQYAPAQALMKDMAVVMVSFIQPRVEAPPKEEPVPEPPKPKPVVKKPDPPKPKAKPILAVPESVPMPATPAVQVPVITAAEPPPPVAAPPAPPAPPAPLVAPRFDADYLSNPAPAYPPLSRRLGEEGRVLLRVLVSADGVPQQVEVKQSSGHERLDQSAVATVWRWKFVPARRGATPVEAWVVIPISFTLKG